MSNIVWLGALLAINICFALPQSPGILVQPGSSSPNIISLSINTKKYVHTISDHFLSITLEPSTIFSALQKNPNFGFVFNISFRILILIIFYITMK